MQNQALVGLRSVARAEFVVHVGNGRIDLLTPVPAFGKLLRAQSNEDAEDNHPTSPNNARQPCSGFGSWNVPCGRPPSRVQSLT